MGWVGGWLGGCVGGCGRDIKGLSNSHFFKYVNKQDELIPNIRLKVIRGFYTKTCEHLKFQN